jgi:hypothetical protein
LYLSLIGFGAERRGQYPPLLRSPSEHEFLLAGFDRESRETLLLEQQDFLLDGILSLMRFFLRKLDDIEIQAESG